MVYVIILIALAGVGCWLLFFSGFRASIVYINLTDSEIERLEIEDFGVEVGSLIKGEHSVNSFSFFPRRLPDFIKIIWKDAGNPLIHSYQIDLGHIPKIAQNGMLILKRKSEEIWDVEYRPVFDIQVLLDYHTKNEDRA